MPDPNFPGMRVCKDDLDKFDPWRLPARQTENIALRFPRPDVSIALDPTLVDTQGDPNTFQQYDNFIIEGALPGSNTQGNIDLNSAYQTAPSPLTPFLYNSSPIVGPLAGGTTVVINGANLNTVTTVKFGGVSSSFSIVNPNQIIAVTPAGSVTGLVDITVLSTYGTATLHGAFTYQ
jgi:hypothetical protein